MNKEEDKILYISDIVVHSNPFELNVDFIRNECKFMDKEDIYKWILEDELKLKDLQLKNIKLNRILDDVEEWLDNQLSIYNQETIKKDDKLRNIKGCLDYVKEKRRERCVKK